MNVESFKPYHEDNLFILGRWFSRERKQRGYSTRGLSRASNITPSLISDIENQKVRPHIETLQQLYAQLNLTFITEMDRLAAIQENILSLYYAIYDQNIETVKTFYTGIKAQSEVLRYSPITIDILIIEGLIPTLLHDQNIPPAFYALKNHLSYLSTVQKERFFISLGYQQFKEAQYDDALDSFKQAISFNREGRGYTASLEMIAAIYSKKFKPLLAIEYASRASKLNAKWSNIIRKIQSDFIQIKGYIETNQFNHAETLIRNLSYVLVESDQRQWYELRAFEAYLAYKKGLHQEAIQKIETIPVRHVYLDLLLLHVYIQSESEKAQSQYEHLINIHPSSTHPVLNAIIQLIQHQKTKIPNALMDEAIEVVINNIHQIDEMDGLKEVVAIGAQYAMVKNDINTLEKWFKFSQKLLNFNNILS
jgi:transcriptional regulator with XRE-family HTH domain